MQFSMQVFHPFLSWLPASPTYAPIRAAGLLQPAASATLHNLSTLGISLRSMTSLLPAALPPAEGRPGQ